MTPEQERQLIFREEAINVVNQSYARGEISENESKTFIAGYVCARENVQEEFEKLRSFCLDYQTYAKDILHSVNVFKSFHELRKGAYAYAIARSSKPKWGYRDVS